MPDPSFNPEPDDRSDVTPPESAVILARRPDGAVAWIDPDKMQFTYSRSGGPGGQSVNKLSSRAQLRVALDDLAGLDGAALGRLRRMAGQRLTVGDEILIAAETHRSPHRNRQECVSRLRDLVQRAFIPPKPRKKTRPSRAAVRKRLDEKKRQSEKKRQRGRPRPDD